MIQRIRQFYWAIWGKMDIGIHTFVRSYLTDDEQELFYAMHPADRFHSFHVALTAKEIYREERHLSSDDYIFLIRCALLHDIGKTKGTTDVWGKVLSVLARRFFPSTIPFFVSKKDKSGICGKVGTAFYVSYHHPEIGAEKLRMIGRYREAVIVAQHQKKEAPEDDPVLSILKRADARN